MLSMLRGGMDLTSTLIYLLSTVAVIFLTLPIHEFAHGYIAVKLGDPTPRYQGRLTLNPLAHLDLMGSLSMLLIGVGWARPVQINARNFKNPKRDMAISAAAGPIANLILAVIVLILSNILMVAFNSLMPQNTLGMIFVYLYSFLQYVAYISVYLAVFNLIPIPPLDGSRLASAFLPDKYYYMLMRYEQFSFVIFMVIIYVSSKLGFNPISNIASGFVDFMESVILIPFSLLLGE